MTDRALNWTMGGIFGGAIALVVAVAIVAILAEPRNRARYMAECGGRGFSADQCAFLYRQNREAEAANAAAMAAFTASTAASITATRR